MPPPGLDGTQASQYLIGNPPSWMMRYGITMIGIFFLLLLLAAWRVQYPDIVEAGITLTTARPPVRVLSPVGGRVVALLAQEGQPVEKGTLLAVMESTADWQEVLRLETWLSGADTATHLPSMPQLGSLQNAYSAFCQHWRDRRYFTSNPGTAVQIGALSSQIFQLEQINTNLSLQKEYLSGELALSTRERERQTKLRNEKVISDMEWEKAEALWLQQKRQMTANESALLQNQMQIAQLKSQIAHLRQTQNDQANDKNLALTEDLQRLRSEVAIWKQQYLITAPIAGRVSLSGVWSAQQNVAANAEVLAILPAHTDFSVARSDAERDIIGKATIAASALSKITSGQRVLVRLDGFPPQRYGMVEGYVTFLSQLPQKDAYQVEVSLPDSLRGSYGHLIPFHQEMSGQARIITEERRIITRLFERIRELFRSNAASKQKIF
jgi:multidrug efflux pump subunit AcrA (membrane-fusion protein)